MNIFFKFSSGDSLVSENMKEITLAKSCQARKPAAAENACLGTSESSVLDDHRVGEKKEQTIKEKSRTRVRRSGRASLPTSRFKCEDFVSDGKYFS